jgi:glycosyltransferase involved in cell wall biosynthesis
MRRTIKRVGRALLGRFGMAPGSGPAGIWSGYAFDAAQLAQHMDCDYAALGQAQQHPERVHPEVRRRSCNWYLPVFDHAFYGGIMTILRLAAHLQAKQGIRQRFLICGACDVARVAALLAAAFPTLAQAEVLRLDSDEAVRNIPPSDYSVATLWITAYVLLKVTNTGSKFYMIQDYEPLFYPAGSTSAQAELTYRFGFHGIANTESIRDIYERDFGGRGVVLRPCVDTKIFYPAAELRGHGVKRLFCYTRPGTPRNGFELAAVVLRRLKDQYGKEIEIVCAGAAWDPEDFGLAGVVRNMGLLAYADTADLYRSCHAGLVMMMTRHPSYLPFELMACGCLVVSNLNPANAWFLKDGENCLLSPPTVSCLATTVTRALDNYSALATLRRAAANRVRNRHGDWEKSLEQVARFMNDLQSGGEHLISETSVA